MRRLLCRLDIHTGHWGEPTSVEGWQHPGMFQSFHPYPVTVTAQARKCECCGVVQIRRVGA
jgi:hypothetical protein